MHRDVVRSLWIGNRLGAMEQLCIRSFLAHGHPFVLYAYDHIANAPDGCEVRDGREILPDSEIFVYKTGKLQGNPSAFSNLFRYKMLLDKGGWWADLDAACTRPLQFDADHVLGDEREPDGSLHAATGLFKAPAGSPLIERCYEHSRRIDRERVRWGQIGPQLMKRMIDQSQGEQIEILPPEAFYPVDYWRVEDLVAKTAWPEESYSVHLWNSRWRMEGLDPDALYPPGCIYEQLMARYMPEGMLDESTRPQQFGLLKKGFFKSALANLKQTAKGLFRPRRHIQAKRPVVVRRAA